VITQHEAIYAAAARASIATAENCTAAMVVYAGAQTVASIRPMMAGGDPGDFIDQVIAADPLAAAAEAELGPQLLGGIAEWLAQHWAEIAAAGGDAVALHRLDAEADTATAQVAAACARAAQAMVLEHDRGVAAAVVAGVAAATMVARGKRTGTAWLAEMRTALMDPLAAVAAEEIGAVRTTAMVAWADEAWPEIAARARRALGAGS
jgi:hypothetical protein